MARYFRFWSVVILGAGLWVRSAFAYDDGAPDAQPADESRPSDEQYAPPPPEYSGDPSYYSSPNDQQVSPSSYPPEASGAESPASFHSALSPYGEWITIPGYGQVWRPYESAVGGDFFPYATGGQWVYSDYGWYFSSGYPWGWAPFHYGRWLLRPALGWVWLPGSVWAPAWVSWRLGGGYVGWAPLGPAGMAYVRVGRPAWCFVETRHFGVGNVYNYALPAHRLHYAYAATSRLPGQMVIQGARWNVGPPASHIAAVWGAPVRAAAIQVPRNVRMAASRVSSPGFGSSGGQRTWPGRAGSPGPAPVRTIPLQRPMPSNPSMTPYRGPRASWGRVSSGVNASAMNVARAPVGWRTQAPAMPSAGFSNRGSVASHMSGFSHGRR